MPIQPLPKISLGVPAFTNDDFTGAFPASHANDAAYGDTDYWRCAATPVGNANAGTLTTPVYLAYDLSGVASGSRGQVVVAWYNDCPGTGAYDAGLIVNPYNNIANAYTIDVNPAAGGTLPTSGWVTKVTVTGNTLHSRQHSLDMTGNNWIRINVTAITGSASNNNVSMNMDVHDAHLGVVDDWIFYGDSITQRAFNHDDRSATGQGNILPAQINASHSTFFPIWEGAGMGGWTATDLQPQFATWLALFPGKYVAINMGTNDANLGAPYTTNFQSKMTSMVQAVLAAGKVPVIPHIPWGASANSVANVPTLNTQIDTIIAANPGSVAGPDLYTYFLNNQTQISGDGLHPTDPAGYVAYRNQWLNWANANYYSLKSLAAQARVRFNTRSGLRSSTVSKFTVAKSLKSLARSVFRIGKPRAIKAILRSEVQHLNATFSESAMSNPFTTIDVSVTVTDMNNSVVTNLSSAVCVVLFPDGTTQTISANNMGSGLYVVTYTTKSPGLHRETWTFNDVSGGTAQYTNITAAAY